MFMLFPLSTFLVQAYNCYLPIHSCPYVHSHHTLLCILPYVGRDITSLCALTVRMDMALLLPYKLFI